MQKLILLGFFAAILLPAAAAQRVTVKELEQKLATPVAVHGPGTLQDSQISAETDLLQQLGQDSVIAPQIESLELTERLTRVTLKRFVASYQLGPQAQMAVEQLADRSALLDPPASELPVMAPPDAQTQHKIVASARAWLFQTLAHLPNFFALRTTARFDNTPPLINGRDLTVTGRLHMQETSTREITFRDGKEVVNPLNPARLPNLAPGVGLESAGEFGPEPAIVLLDLDSGSLAFHHWERTSSGPAVVFRYSVPSSGSHYEVNYRCMDKALLHKNPSYHGTISIDPASGAILRLALEADWKPGDPVSHIASVIEYGPVVLGDRYYICPERSLAFMVEEANACVRGRRSRKPGPALIMLNRTTFAGYHRLGSTSRIVSEKLLDSAASPGPASPANAQQPAAAGSAPPQKDQP
jgi:hypothetical protein